MLWISCSNFSGDTGITTVTCYYHYMNKELKPTDIKIIKGKAAGKTSKQMEKEVGLKAQSIRKRLQNSTIQDAVRAEMIRQGITLAKVIKPITDGLEASDEVYSKTGEYLGERVNHSVRLQASDRAAKLMGITSASESDKGSQLSSEDIQALADQSDEIKLTELVFKRQ